MKALDDLRIIDFGHVWAGPFCGQVLSDLGAEVIRVESNGHLDVHRRAGPYAGEPGVNASTVWNAQNRGKMSCTLNLKEPRAVDLALHLVGTADAVIENFTPGTLARLGLGFERLVERNPRLVLVSLSGYGQDGPWRRYPAYGPMMDAVGGLSYALRTEAGVPQSLNGWFPDTSAALYAAFGVLAALRDVGAGGEGVHLDVSELESTLSLLPELLALEVAGDAADPPTGAVHSNVTGAGDLALVVPTVDEEAWVALRLETAADWRAVLAELDLTLEPVPPVSEADRARARAALTEACARRRRDALCEALQDRGVEAVPVMSARDLLEDEHLAARGAFASATYPDSEALRSYTPVIGRSVDDPPPRARAPLLGEHNAEVFEGILGLTRDERLALEGDRVIW